MIMIIPELGLESRKIRVPSEMPRESERCRCDSVGGLTPVAGIPRDPFLEIRPGDNPE